MSGRGILTKDPAAVLDYRVDFRALTNGVDGAVSDWLESGETIATATVTPETGITVDSDSLVNTASAVEVWLSGGDDGEDYDVTVRIVTSAGRTDERTLRILCRDR